MNKIHLFAFAALMGLGMTGMQPSAQAAVRTESVMKAAVFAEKEYTDVSGLQLTYGGAPMIGKSVKFIPDANDSKKGTLVMASSFDMALIPGIPDDFKKTVPGPGVIPGSPEYRLAVTLEPSADGREAEFRGETATDFLTFSYAGTLTGESLILNIIDPKLKNTAMVGDWMPKPYVFDEVWQEVESNPIHIVWESDVNLDVLGMEMPLSSLLQLVTRLPLIDVPENNEGEGKNVSQKLVESLKRLSFGEDANITADVLTAEGKDVTSPGNMVQYVVTGDNAFLLYLDPTAIAAADAEAKKAPRNAEEADPSVPELPDFTKILSNVLTQVTPLLANGVPMVYERTEGNLFIGLDQQIILPLLKNNVVPLLEDKELIQLLCSILEEDETMGDYASMIPGIAESLVNVINSTTKIEIGIDMTTWESGVETLPAEKAGTVLRTETGRYNLAGERVGSDYEGVVIIRYNDGTAAKHVVRK